MLFMAVLDPLFAAFALVFVSEIGDKTQLVLLGLAASLRAPVPVFTGALSAIVLLDAAAVLLGGAFPLLFSPDFVRVLAGIAFSVLGVVTLARREEEDVRVVSARGAFATAFLTAAVSEVGDKSQLSALFLSAQYQAVFLVFLGAVLALGLATALTVFVGSRFAQRLPARAVRIASGLLFLAFGVAALLR